MARPTHGLPSTSLVPADSSGAELDPGHVLDADDLAFLAVVRTMLSNWSTSLSRPRACMAYRNRGADPSAAGRSARPRPGRFCSLIALIASSTVMFFSASLSGSSQKRML